MKTPGVEQDTRHDTLDKRPLHYKLLQKNGLILPITTINVISSVLLSILG